MKILLATHNKGKIAEFRDLLQMPAIEWIPQSDYGISDIEETGLSFIENALLKARHASQASGLPALADDSGLCVEALKGEPGIYSARYAGEHGNASLNIKKLLQVMQDVPLSQRDAYFVCCLAYVASPTDQMPIICQATWRGEILLEEQGANGFGYDPVFYVPEYDCSVAQLDLAIKNQISHRAQALEQLRKAFQVVAS